MRRAYLILVLALLGADPAGRSESAPLQPGPKPAGGTISGSVVVVDGRTKVARDDVYVYLVDAQHRRHRGPAPGAGKKFEIRQAARKFVPDVLVVPVGAEVTFTNYDNEEHNVFSPTDPPFDLGRYNTDKKGRFRKFEDVDEFDIFCDIHRWMAAKVKVVDSAYIAQVKAGQFTFTNVPPGLYKVMAWVKNSPEVFEEVTVTAGATTKLSAELHLQLARRSGCHDRKDGSPYPARYNPCPPED